MKKIIEIVDGKEFPSLDDLTNMPSDNIFNYINSTFCTACANMLKNKTAYMIARYSVEENMDYSGSYFLANDDEVLKSYYDNIKELNNISDKEWYHTDLGRYCIDDVIICGETYNNYYAIWLDRDVSDCSIIKVSKEHYDCLHNFNIAIIDYFESLEFKINEIRYPTGWLKW